MARSSTKTPLSGHAEFDTLIEASAEQRMVARVSGIKIQYVRIPMTRGQAGRTD